MTDLRPTRIDLTFELQAFQQAASAVFVERVLAAGLKEARFGDWPTPVKSLEVLGDPELRVAGEVGAGAIYELEGALVHVELWGSHVHAVAAAPTRDAVDKAFSILAERFPPPDPSSAHEVPVTFWTYTPHGPQPSWRSIAVPAWDEIEPNYAEATRTSLGALMREFEPAHGGQLILWHGQAGTGKTFALRALGWEWREWCQIHYIVDPDSFFGEHADYLMSVLLQPPFPMMVGDERFGHSVAMMAMDSAEAVEEDSRLWRLLVMEDTGELLTADARERAGQGLSRFLNVVDGLIGQGLRVLVLVTTNEEIRRLHPAVARPGRCAANVIFLPLEADEASRWLRERGIGGEADGSRTLASLYAQLEGRDPSETVLVGFGG
jgi:hypothetical protein